MTTYRVAGVRKQWSTDPSHQHIEGVCTIAGVHYTRQQVVDSITAGDTWKTSTDGYPATIETVVFCPKSGCHASPYITTRPLSTKPLSTKIDRLENRDLCHEDTTSRSQSLDPEDRIFGHLLVGHPVG